jgi:hypothetical protein
MKPELLDKTPASPRRRWLGAVSAAAAGFVAWAWRGHDRLAAISIAKPNHLPNPVSDAAKPSAVVRIMVRPSPDSVKRHG